MLLGRYAALDKLAGRDRDYKREYQRDHASPKAKRHRAMRNKWNRRLKGRVPAGYEIDHVRQLRHGGGNGVDNIRLLPVSQNRSEHNRGMRKHAAVAIKRDPAKWEAAKREARAKMGGKHSARAMQLAVQIYKKKGGEYAGKKPSPSSNKLRKWTKQKWQWSGGDREGQGGKGVYLPKRSASALKSTREGRARLAQAVREKRRATARGEQFSQHGLHVGKKRSEVR